MKKAGLIALLFLWTTYTYARDILVEEQDLINQYGAIRAEMVRKAFKYCDCADASVLNDINDSDLTEFINAIDKPESEALYNVVNRINQKLSGTDIIEYHSKLIVATCWFRTDLRYIVFNKESDESSKQTDYAGIENDYNSFLKSINDLTKELLSDVSSSRDGKTAVAGDEAEDNNIDSESGGDDKSFSYLWIILLAILTLSGAYILYRNLIHRRSINIPVNREKKEEDSERNSSPAKDDSVNERTKPDSDIIRNIQGSEVKYERFAVENNNWIIVGASVTGRSHIESKMPCQDSHSYSDLGNGWGLAIVSDGAGSAKYSHIGSRLVVSMAQKYFERLIQESLWYRNNTLPDDLTWDRMVYKALKAVRDGIQKAAEEKQFRKESFAATVIVVVHTPMGLLSAHIGDGRSGYQDKSGVWHPLMQPHKGEEANQTIFITSDFWKIPHYEMSGVSVPETRIVRESVKSFVLMSDGCEFTSWNCNQYNAVEGKFYDPNTPHSAFFNPLTETLREHKKNSLPFDMRSEKWYGYLDAGNKSFISETDDKTMILGTISQL